MTVGPSITSSPASPGSTSLPSSRQTRATSPHAGRPIGSGSVRSSGMGPTSWQVQTLVSVGPYQLRKRTGGGKRRRSAPRCLMEKTSPAKISAP